MRIIFSRKGFDSSAGGAPSPIVEGRPLSLPIPASGNSDTTYGDLGLGAHAAEMTRGKLDAASLCHDDPMFADGKCWFGQCGAAQGHLAKQGVGEGDVFLFFGLYADPATGERHHRIFGHMTIACAGSPEEVRDHPAWSEPPRPHPHRIGEWPGNNTLYHGPGGLARSAAASLRLTRAEGPLNRWRVPSWLREYGLTYHAKPERWTAPGELDSAKRGQEFVCDIGDAAEPRRWLDAVLAEMD